MLAKLVRPLVRSQIQLLTQADSVQGRLMGMVSQWLSYLGIKAEVTELKSQGNQIQVSLCVGRPEQCSNGEWQQILDKLSQDSGSTEAIELRYDKMTPEQQRKVQRLLACIIQAGEAESQPDWLELKGKLASLNLSEPLLQGIRSALKIRGNLAPLLTDLDPKVAAFVLSKAIAISLMDQRITASEDSALKALYSVIETSAKV